MNQIYLAVVLVPTSMFSFISGNISCCNFQLALSKTPNLTLDISFSKTRKITYYKIFFTRKCDCFGIFFPPCLRETNITFLKAFKWRSHRTLLKGEKTMAAALGRN